jgi:rhodanese-related sulfurtransferase
MMKKLSLLSLLLVMLVAVYSFTQQQPLLVSPINFQNQLNENVVLIDVRTAEEFNNGHLENALNIDYYNANFIEDINRLNKEKKVMVYCKSGGRSAGAVTILKQNGFKNIVELDGGYIAWSKANLPTKK